jgi:hypothetical protein
MGHLYTIYCIYLRSTLILDECPSPFRIFSLIGPLAMDKGQFYLSFDVGIPARQSRFLQISFPNQHFRRAVITKIHSIDLYIMNIHVCSGDSVEMEHLKFILFYDRIQPFREHLQRLI